MSCTYSDTVWEEPMTECAENDDFPLKEKEVRILIDDDSEDESTSKWMNNLYQDSSDENPTN